MVNRQDVNPGKIDEVVIDAKDDLLAYEVLAIGDFLGMVNKLFAMLWKAFEFHAAEHKLILNMNKEKLKAAPVFDKDTRWPDFSGTLGGKSI